MPEDIRGAGTLQSRLALLEEKLDETVLQFCEDTQGETLARSEKTARTLATLLRESERIEDMKKKYEQGSDDTGTQDDPAEAERVEERLMRKFDRIAATLKEAGMAEEPHPSGKKEP